MKRNTYGIIGNPVKESKSEFIQTTFAKNQNLDILYKVISSTKEDFIEDVRGFFFNKGAGLNVTVPFKEYAYQIADKLTDRAETAKSVNTLTLTGDGLLMGDNTDGFGLVSDLDRLLIPVKGKSVLVIGAGGATRGILKPLLDLKPENITIVNRTHEKAVKLSKEFALYGNIKSEKIENTRKSFDIVINTTSGDQVESLNISSKIFNKKTFAYDISYKNKLTKFLKYAMSNGCSNQADGAGMLVFQGAESFSLWHKERPEINSVILELQKIISTD